MFCVTLNVELLKLCSPICCS